MLMWLNCSQCLLNSFINIRGTSTFNSKIQFFNQKYESRRVFLLTLLCYLASSLHVHHASHHLVDEVRHQTARAYYNSNGEPDLAQLRWLSNIADNKLISMLSIPGTHYSGTYYNCRDDQACLDSQCQSWNITGQLMAGIRFLDLRVMTDDSVIMVGHGPYKMVELKAIFSSVAEYLDAHLSQFVILSFQKESGTEQKISQIMDLMRASGLYWEFTRSRIPTVGELRGKVWIVNGEGYDIPRAYPLYGELEQGVPFVIKQKQDVIDAPGAYIQNMQEVSRLTLRKKSDLVIETAKRSCDEHRLQVNCLSGGSQKMPPDFLASLPGGPNQALDVWLRDNHAGCLGITVMDFPGTGLIQKIIKTNQ